MFLVPFSNARIIEIKSEALSIASEKMKLPACNSCDDNNASKVAMWERVVFCCY